MGLAGQSCSHAPQPMQRSESIMGICGEAGSSADLGIMLIAFVGQWRAQFPQATLSAFTMQRSLSQTAIPICIEDFSAIVIFCIAFVGQTSEHFTHSGRQYPRS
jgi:hypothetical protein